MGRHVAPCVGTPFVAAVNVVTGTKIIDITCLDDLWSDLAAEVPILASPSRYPGEGLDEDDSPRGRRRAGLRHGWQGGGPDADAALEDAAAEERRLFSEDMADEDVQDHIKSIVSQREKRQQDEVRMHFDRMIVGASARKCFFEGEDDEGYDTPTTAAESAEIPAPAAVACADDDMIKEKIRQAAEAAQRRAREQREQEEEAIRSATSRIKQAAEDAYMRRRTAEAEPAQGGEGQAALGAEAQMAWAAGEDGSAGAWSAPQPSLSQASGWGDSSWIASTSPPPRPGAGAFWNPLATQAPQPLQPRFAPPALPPALPVSPGVMPAAGAWECEATLTAMTGPCVGPARHAIAPAAVGLVTLPAVTPPIIGTVIGPALAPPRAPCDPGAMAVQASSPWGTNFDCDPMMPMKGQPIYGFGTFSCEAPELGGC